MKRAIILSIIIGLPFGAASLSAQTLAMAANAVARPSPPSNTGVATNTLTVLRRAPDGGWRLVAGSVRSDAFMGPGPSNQVTSKVLMGPWDSIPSSSNQGGVPVARSFTNEASDGMLSSHSSLRSAEITRLAERLKPKPASDHYDQLMYQIMFNPLDVSFSQDGGPNMFKSFLR
jgi:hypothetical protein